MSKSKVVDVNVPQIQEFLFHLGVEGSKGNKKLQTIFYVDGRPYFIETRKLEKSWYRILPLLDELVEHALHFSKTRGRPLRIRFENGKKLGPKGDAKDSEKVRQPELIRKVKDDLKKLGKKTNAVVIGNFNHPQEIY